MDKKKSRDQLLQELGEKNGLVKYALASLEALGISPVRNPKFTALRRILYSITMFGTWILLIISIIVEKGNIRNLAPDVYAPTQQVKCKINNDYVISFKPMNWWVAYSLYFIILALLIKELLALHNIAFCGSSTNPTILQKCTLKASIPQMTCKFLFTVFLRKQMLNVLERMNVCWPDDKFGPGLEATLKEKKEQFRKIYFNYRILIWATVVIYVIRPVFSKYQSLMFNWYYPYSDDAEYMIPNILLQQYYIIVLGHSILAFDAMFFSYLSHCFIQLEAIKYAFKNLNFDQSEDVIFTNFVEIVKHHNYMLRMINDINKIYSVQLLNQFFTVMLCICCGIFLLNMDGFPPSTSRLLTFVPYLGCYHFQLYMYCAIGEEIAQQATSISNALYESDWYFKHHPKMGKGLQMVINVTKIANKLTIGGFWYLNLKTFMMVMKTSMSFNTFMQTVYNKK